MSHSSTHRDASDLRPLEGSRAGRLAPDLFSGLSPLGRHPSRNPWQGRIGHPCHCHYLRGVLGETLRANPRILEKMTWTTWVIAWNSIQIFNGRFLSGPAPRGLRRPPRAIAIPCPRLPEAWPKLRDHGWSRGRCLAANDSRVWATSGRALGGPDARTIVQCLQLGLEPTKGLASKLALRGFVGERVILALSGGGQSGGAGGIVTILGQAVVAELRVSFQGFGQEPGRRVIEFLVDAHLGQGQAIGGVLRADLLPSAAPGDARPGPTIRSASATHRAEGKRQPGCLVPSSCPLRSIASDPA